MKPVMGYGVWTNQQLEAEHPACQILQGERRHSLARLGLLSPDALCDAQQKRAGPGGRVEDRNTRVAQALRKEILSQSPIESGYDIAHYLDRRIIDAIFLSSNGIKGGQEIFVEIEDRIASVLSDSENFRSKAIDRVAHDSEANTSVSHDFIEAQHAQRRSHQRVFRRHVSPGIWARRVACSFAHQQQTKGERLREGGGKQGIEIGSAVTRCLRVGVEDVPEFLPYLQKRVIPVCGGINLGQTVLNDPSDEAGGMRHQRREVFGITRARLLSCGLAQPFDQVQERGRVMLRNRSIGTRIVSVGPEGVLGY